MQCNVSTMKHELFLLQLKIIMGNTYIFISFSKDPFTIYGKKTAIVFLSSIYNTGSALFLCHGN
jgi:hypothetical protein